TGGLCHLHSGVARLALETGAPIIPVGIALETDHIRLMGAGVTDANGEEEIARLYSGNYAITIGQALVLAGDVEDHDYVKRLTDYLGQHISRLMRRSTYRLQPASVSVTQQTAEFPSL
ncbi:MAG TPA: hypothetical protein VHO69_04775, partial [Phototrophicaceae bacterium]|nr:hypothetical protein [Phototrophicaceae bacterium]